MTLIPEDLPKQQGAKGRPAHRINMAFSPANYEALRLICEQYEGINMTALVNCIIDIYRTEHREVIETAQNRKRIQGSGLLPGKTKKEPGT